VIEEAQHALEQQTVLAAAELLRHDNAGMRAAGRLPMLVERSKIANVECEKRAVLPSCKRELVFIRGGVVTGLFGPQDVESTAAQLNSQTRHDMTIEVQPNEERFRAGGIGHWPALPRR
jgi:hypothetical protein